MITKTITEERIPLYILVLMLAFIFHDFPRYGVMFPSSAYAVIILVLTIYLFCNITLKDRNLLFSLFSVFILDLLINSFTKSSYVLLQDFSSLLQELIPVIMAMMLVRKRYIHSAKIILGFYFLRIIITMVTTIIGLQIFPGASRDLGNGEFVAKNPLYQVYLSLNIGGFDLVYTIVLLIPIFCYLFKYSSEYKYSYTLKLIMAVLIVFSMYCILQMEYTTAFLLSIFALTSLFTTKETNVRKYLALLFVAGIILYITKGIFAQVLDYMSEMVESKEIAVRFSDLANSISGQVTSDASDVDARQEVYSKSLNAIVNNPFGTWLSSNEAGGHSFILDYIAKYGFVGWGLIIYMLRVVYKSQLKPYLGKNIYPFLVLDYLLFIATAIMNPHLYISYIAFVIPLFYIISDHYKNTNNASSI